MVPWIAWTLALISTGICLFLWFRDVRRVLRQQYSIVESAEGQLRYSRAKVRQCRNPENEEVFLRSENIYRQAAAEFDRLLRKPGIYLPARLMGYHSLGNMQEKQSEK